MAPASGLQHLANFHDDATTTSTAASRSGSPSVSASASVSSLSLQLLKSRLRADPSHLAPEDAFVATPPYRRLSGFDMRDRSTSASGNERRAGRPRGEDVRKESDGRGEGSRSRSRRRKKTWKKLLWVKQSYPDNYTDQATFLDNLQRNPRVQPYDFWPLFADSTVIVQHICSVIIFVVCFVGIFQERVSPVAIAGWGSAATFLGWLLWDYWVAQEPGDVDNEILPGRSRSLRRGTAAARQQGAATRGVVVEEYAGGMKAGQMTRNNSELNLPSVSSLNLPLAQDRPPLASTNSSTNLAATARNPFADSTTSLNSSTSAPQFTRGPHADLHAPPSPRSRSPSPFRRTGRGHLRMSTIKSAVLIYFTLLGLSPILKSLTKSTSSDSIWAMSFWLLAINIFFFDYSSTTSSPSVGGPQAGSSSLPVVASLSTNAALMASTVLASRLPSTGQVFSLTLFSIEVFGLFPVFGRLARHRSWRYHIMLTIALVLGAGAGVGIILREAGEVWPWRAGLVGMFVGCLITALAVGGCSWWLIGLQKYKNEIYGPWDPARPIIMSRRQWGDE